MTDRKSRIYKILTECEAVVYSDVYIKIPETIFEKYKHLNEEDVIKTAYINGEFTTLFKKEKHNLVDNEKINFICRIDE